MEALSTPVVAPVMGLFGGRRDSLFVNPFKQVTKAPCKFHLLQGACSSPVVCSAPLFLPCTVETSFDLRIKVRRVGKGKAPSKAGAISRCKSGPGKA